MKVPRPAPVFVVLVVSLEPSVRPEMTVASPSGVDPGVTTDTDPGRTPVMLELVDFG